MLDIIKPDTSAAWIKVARRLIPLPQRIILAIMTFLGIVNAFGTRICLSTTIVAIVVPKNKTLHTSIGCPYPADYATDSIYSDPIYNWDETLIGYIMSSFYVGYVFSHLPGGILSDMMGGKIMLAGCVLLTGIFALITPIVIVKFGPYFLIIVQLLMGMMQGIMYPAVNALLASWVPLDERAFYGSMIYSSATVGVVYATLVPGFILGHYHSWSLVFYIFGINCVLWALFFILLCSSQPSNHLYITDKEKQMLIDKIGVMKPPLIEDIPWLGMVTNVPLIALVIAQFGHNFGFYLIITYFPTYMSNVLHYNIRMNGLLSSLPFIVTYVLSCFTGVLADYIIRNKLMSLVKCRKLFSALGTFLPSLGMILASYAGCDRDMVVVWMIIGMATTSFYYSGFRVNTIDLGPRYAGITMGFVNGIGAITGIIQPLYLTFLTKGSTVEEFRIVFWISFILMDATCVLYLCLASGDAQPFNDLKAKS